MKKSQHISPIDLNTIIMSVVHEVKNSLLFSSTTLSQLNSDIAPALQPKLDKVQNEIEGVNQSLMRMLILYKMQTDVFSVNSDLHNLYDFFEDITITSSALFKSKRINFSIECDEYLDWYFDLDLLTIAINTVLHNSIRYAKKNITLKAFITENNLTIRVQDDGIGFPEKMLSQGKPMNTKIESGMSHSGLGLFFTQTIAKLHNNNNKHGYTQISNLSSGGGCFSIYIP